MTELSAAIKAKDWDQCFPLFRSAAAGLSQPTEDLIWLSKQLRKIPQTEFKSRGFVCKKIAVLNGYTSSFVIDCMRVQLVRLGIYLEVFDSDFGQVEQMIHSKPSALKEFGPDLVYLFAGTDHLASLNPSDEVNRWMGLVQEAHQWLKCDVLLNSFEEPLARVHGHRSLRTENDRSRLVKQVNLELSQNLPSYAHLIDVDFLASAYGRLNWRDEKLYDVAKIPVAYALVPALSAAISAVVAGIFGRSKKCIVVDLDNTIWGGVVGDDGAAHLDIGPGSARGEAFFRFQSFLKSLVQRGVILAVCSKNERSIALDAFSVRSDMPLKLEDISCFVANWDTKAQNIQSIARQLNIGLDSIVFVDDNPAEREIVRQMLPEVDVLEMPQSESTYTTVLSAYPFFETPRLTQDDLQRTAQYLANQQRAELAVSTGDYTEYLKSLEMIAVVAPFDALNLARITQLINKTNQFNLTTKRYAESEIADLMADPNVVTRFVKLKDRFGDNGLISVFIGKINNETLEIDTWLMSCRVLKRQIENLLLNAVVLEAQKRSTQYLRGVYLPTSKNAMVAELYQGLGFERDLGYSGPGTAWTLKAHKVPAIAERSKIPIALDAGAGL